MSMTHTKTNTQTKTNTKYFKDPCMLAQSTGFKDFKYDMDMDMYNMVVMDIDVVRQRQIQSTSKTQYMLYF